MQDSISPGDLRSIATAMTLSYWPCLATVYPSLMAVRKKKSQKIVIAVPVGEREVCNSFKQEADTDIICAMMPQPFNPVDTFYRHFAPTTDVEVQQLLRQVQQTKAAA